MPDLSISTANAMIANGKNQNECFQNLADNIQPQRLNQDLAVYVW
jgi:hypothetical protein